MLFAHLVLFGFIYPEDRQALPRWVLTDLIERLRCEIEAGAAEAAPEQRLCLGTLLSRSQYRFDLEERGYRDGRLPPNGSMDPMQIALWNVRERQERD